MFRDDTGKFVTIFMILLLNYQIKLEFYRNQVDVFYLCYFYW